MPRIAQSQDVDLGRYGPAMAMMEGAPASNTVPAPPAVDAPSPFMRCPMPAMSRSVDGLRQFYRAGIPQLRILSTPSLL